MVRKGFWVLQILHEQVSQYLKSIFLRHNHWLVCRLIDWLIVRSISRLIDWLIVRLISRLIDWLIVRLISRLIDWLIVRLISRLIDWLIDFSFDWLIDWLIDWSLFQLIFFWLVSIDCKIKMRQYQIIWSLIGIRINEVLIFLQHRNEGWRIRFRWWHRTPAESHGVLPVLRDDAGGGFAAKRRFETRDCRVLGRSWFVSENMLKVVWHLSPIGDVHASFSLRKHHQVHVANWRCPRFVFTQKHHQVHVCSSLRSLDAQTNQVESFIDEHGGPGVQHVGLYTSDIVGTATGLRERGVSLQIPPMMYYSHVRNHSHLSISIDKEDSVFLLFFIVPHGFLVGKTKGDSPIRWKLEFTTR